eukprot:SAG11_NODE_32128_length_286_cov_0.796791_1_plen_41_part_01
MKSVIDMRRFTGDPDGRRAQGVSGEAMNHEPCTMDGGGFSQ